jgi:hypothetical protein
LKEKLLKESTKEPEANDKDTPFILSLFPELKKFPAVIKFDIESDLLNVFKRARFNSKLLHCRRTVTVYLLPTYLNNVVITP